MNVGFLIVVLVASFSLAFPSFVEPREGTRSRVSYDNMVVFSCDVVREVKNVLVVAAHPDDIETIAGGTVALLVGCGKRVHYLLTTNGDKGWGKSQNMTQTELAAIREEEQLQAANVLGVSSVTFLRQEDGRLEGVDPIALKQNMTEVFRTVKPELLLTFSPETDYSTYVFGLMHSDHQKTGEVAMNTVWPATRDYMAFPSLAGLATWDVPTVWLFRWSARMLRIAGHDISVVVRLNEAVFQLKSQAMLKHHSQYNDAGAVVKQLRDIGKFVLENFQRIFLAIAEEAVGLEAYQVITIL
jgi:LmbE family N-acetylglucosaminyl deacetylase